jgi:hypothetical protein
MTVTIQRVATIFGAVFLLVGALGFTATGMHMSMGMDAATAPLLLGLFPVNALHNLVHIAFGVWGIWAGRTAGRSVAYALGSGGAYMVLAIAGMLTPTLLGIVPIGGYDVVLHLVLAVVLAGFGFWAMWFAPRQPVAGRATA